MIRKFKCEVTSTSEYEIEFDDEVWNEEELRNWSKVFTDVGDLSELAGILAKYKTQYQAGEFIEGFGITLIDGKRPAFTTGKQLNTDINININYENNMDVDVLEM